MGSSPGKSIEADGMEEVESSMTLRNRVLSVAGVGHGRD